MSDFSKIPAGPQRAPRGTERSCKSWGAEAAMRMLERAPGHPEAVFIDSDLRLHATEGTRERLVMRVELDGDRLPGDTAFGRWRSPVPVASDGPTH